jgi:hypothetical protein
MRDYTLRETRLKFRNLNIHNPIFRCPSFLFPFAADLQRFPPTLACLLGPGLGNLGVNLFLFRFRVLA